MEYGYLRALKWLVVYFILCLIPLSIALAGITPEYRKFSIEFGVALGFLALAIFTLEFLFSGRIKQIAPAFGMDNILHFHKRMGLIGFLFVLGHPITLILADPQFLAYFDPRVNFLRALALSFVTVAVILIIVSSYWRTSFGLSYEKWRAFHGLLALAIVFVGVVHSIRVGHYLDELWQKIAIAVVMGSGMYLVIHTRIVRPYRAKKKPYKITEVIEERADCWTLKIKPDGHEGLSHEAGQFVWITIRETPFSLQQHPFTIASGTHEDGLRFTAKESGDFTGSWSDRKSGEKVFLEGPFGSFTPKKDKNLFLIMGGIGVTPAMSMLRTMKAENDRRKVILIYGSNQFENITFREELDELKDELNLDLIHLLLEPHEGWQGEKGTVEKALIDKYLPKNPHDFNYYICGPKPMMDIAELALRDLKIDWRHIYSERFEIV